jgi:hypothetical protein
MCAAAPQRRSAARRLRRVQKARARLLEHVPCAGPFPTAAEIDAAVTALEAEVAAAKEAGAAVTPAADADVRRRFEVCSGKACVRNGAASVIARARAHGARCDAVVVESKCLKCCKEPGTTVRLAGANTFSVLDVDAVDAIFLLAAGGPERQ